MKKRRFVPLWIKLFVMTSSVVIVLVIFVITVYIYRYNKAERYFSYLNSSNIVHFADESISGYLQAFINKVGSIGFAESLHNAKSESALKYRAYISKQLSAICTENSDINSIFYKDSEGNNFSCGESMGKLKTRDDIIKECRRKISEDNTNYMLEYSDINGWDSAMLCENVVFVDDKYNKIEVGTFLFFFDARKISKKFLEYSSPEVSTSFADAKGNIVFSNDESLIGKRTSDVFTTHIGKIYLKDRKKTSAEQYESEIPHWSGISYIDFSSVKANNNMVNVSVVVFLILCLAGMGMFFYIALKSIGRPLKELINGMKVTQQGELITEISTDKNSEIGEIWEQFQNIIFCLKKQIEQNYEMELKIKEIRLKYYETQMNPHFLFNTLQMIKMMSVLGENENVSSVTVKLAKLLRFNLYEVHEVTLREEIENVENYLYILKKRYKDKFNYRLIITEEILDCYVLKFMLQPFIENAVTHGFVNNDVFEIAVTGTLVNDEIAVVVHDNGSGIEKEKLKNIKESLNGNTYSGYGIGLCNVNERIKLMYGDKYGIDIFSTGSGTSVLVHFPLRKNI